MTFSKPSLMIWTGADGVDHNISDHNRSPLAVAVNRIEEAVRMANGTRRTYIIADKRTFSTDWTDLPQSAAFTVDGFWGKNEIENWYNTQTAPFTLRLLYGDGTATVNTVFMTKFQADISKRGAFDFWKVSVELEEM